MSRRGRTLWFTAATRVWASPRPGPPRPPVGLAPLWIAPESMRAEVERGRGFAAFALQGLTLLELLGPGSPADRRGSRCDSSRRACRPHRLPWNQGPSRRGTRTDARNLHARRDQNTLGLVSQRRAHTRAIASHLARLAGGRPPFLPSAALCHRRGAGCVPQFRGGHGLGLQ